MAVPFRRYAAAHERRLVRHPSARLYPARETRVKPLEVVADDKDDVREDKVDLAIGGRLRISPRRIAQHRMLLWPIEVLDRLRKLLDTFARQRALQYLIGQDR